MAFINRESDDGFSLPRARSSFRPMREYIHRRAFSQEPRRRRRYSMDGDYDVTDEEWLRGRQYHRRERSADGHQYYAAWSPLRNDDIHSRPHERLRRPRGSRRRISIEIGHLTDESDEQEYPSSLESESPRSPASQFRDFAIGQEEDFDEDELAYHYRLGRSRSRLRNPSQSRLRSTSRSRLHSLSRTRSLGPSDARRRNEWLRFRDDTWVNSWADAVSFDDNDELLRPAEWAGKLEILEGQVAINSGFRLYSKLMSTPPIGGYSEHLGWVYQVLSRVMDNMTRMQRARYCGQAINLVVAERKRRNVARLVGVNVFRVSRFAARFNSFLRDYEYRSMSLDRLEDFLQECSEFLLLLGLDLPLLNEEYHYHPLEEGGGYSYVPSRGAHISSIFYATRAIALVLDFATTSFSGAHLKRFDMYFFIDASGSYSIPGDSQGTSILLTQRRFDCLDGFCLDQPVWVFAVNKLSDQTRFRHEPLYLSTTPEDFSAIWGPMWKYASPERRNAALWYLVSPGFLVPGKPSYNTPDLLPGEVLCHWTNNSEDLSTRVGFPAHDEIRRLLIGANPEKLDKNRNCISNAAGFTKQMEDVGYLGTPGTYPGGWTLAKISVPVSMTALLGPVNLTGGVTADIQRKPGVSSQEHVRMRMTTDPEKGIAVLSKSFGVEISACTGNARRMTLAELLVTPTMINLARTVSWKHGELQRWLDALASRDVYKVRTLFKTAHRNGDKDLVTRYNEALQLAFGALVETGLQKHTIRAYWLSNGQPFKVDFPLRQYEWAGALSNDLTKCALVVVNKTCLQCTAASLLCRLRLRSDRFPIGRPSVFETRLVLNEMGKVPPPLRDFKLTGKWTRKMIRKLRRGDEFEMRPAGRLRVIEPLPGGEGIFVEWVHTFIPSWAATRRVTSNLWRNMRGNKPLEHRHYEQIEPFHENQPYLVPIFVVSNPKEFARWLPLRSR